MKAIIHVNSPGTIANEGANDVGDNLIGEGSVIAAEVKVVEQFRRLCQQFPPVTGDQAKPKKVMQLQPLENGF
jgi:hypothetical protein